MCRKLCPHRALHEHGVRTHCGLLFRTRALAETRRGESPQRAALRAAPWAGGAPLAGSRTPLLTDPLSSVWGGAGAGSGAAAVCCPMAAGCLPAALSRGTGSRDTWGVARVCAAFQLTVATWAVLAQPSHRPGAPGVRGELSPALPPSRACGRQLLSGVPGTRAVSRVAERAHLRLLSCGQPAALSWPPRFPSLLSGGEGSTELPGGRRGGRSRRPLR